MIYKVFTVFDSKTEAYMRPFFCQTKGEAIRIFSDTVNQDDTQFWRHPGDFSLFEVGEYDDQHADLRSITPVCLGVAIEYKESEK